MPRTRVGEPLQHTYSRDLRLRVIHQKFKLACTSTQIAIDLDMPLRVVQRTIQRWIEIGDVIAVPHQVGRAQILGPNEKDVS